ncbi:DNA helicase [Pichia kluyveri]|uniref:DNA helicase n=1 Tax=Pichia kluyveri TaxID=36015 RepID=A0AAV5R150_PICKL|nr:DNA helicase [Pichia kluyveri]
MNEERRKDGEFFDHSIPTILPSTNIEEKVPGDDKFVLFRTGLISILGGISETSVKLLYEKFQGSNTPIEDATNAYLDLPQSFTKPIIKSTPAIKEKKKPMQYEYQSRKRGIDSIIGNNEKSKFFKKETKPKTRNTSGKKSNAKPIGEPSVAEKPINDNKWKKYIGTINISCWCTRSVFSLKSIYEHNRLIFVNQPGSGAVYVNHKPENSNFKRELGRLTEEMAELIGPLLEDKAVVFESKLFYVYDERLSTGDSFVIRTDCFLSENIFEAPNSADYNDEFNADQIKMMKNSGGSIQAESRLKSLMLKLFDKLGLKSVQNTTKASSDDLNKPVILEDEDGDDSGSSEVENLEKNVEFDEEIAAGTPTDGTGGESNSEDGSLLSSNHIKDLYKNTEINNLQDSLPETTPNNFNLELRPYQKLGLSWMLQREKEYEPIGSNDEETDEISKDAVIEQLKLHENLVNPLWKEYTWPVLPDRLQDVDLPPNCNDQFYMNLYKGTCSLEKPIIKSNCKGGILADEMGLGKTITTLSLVLSFPKDYYYDILPDNHIEKIKDYAFSTTLIVVPMALLTQWEKEFIKVTKGKDHKLFIYYGSDSLGNLKRMLCGPNPPTVVLTTYGMIQSEWSKMDKLENLHRGTGLFSVRFLRIILDEGHNIRNKSTKTAKAIYSLQADRKWVLTGTPIINRLEDLFSLVHFLGLKPWSYHSLWKQCISVPFDTGKDVESAKELLKSILDPILLRRTKNQKDSNGKFLVELPPKHVRIEKLKFNKREDIIYKWLKERAVNSFNENVEAGLVFKNYSTILTQLLRLRQVCCHVDLITHTNDDTDNTLLTDKLDILNNKPLDQKRLSVKEDMEMVSLVRSIDKFEKEQKIPLEEINKLKNEIYDQYPNFDGVECAICTDDIKINTCVVTECKHCFCLGCLIEHFDFQLKHEKQADDETSEDSPLVIEKVFCPMCREEINKNRLFRTIKKNSNVVQDVVDIDTGSDYLTQKTISQNLKERDYIVRPFAPNQKSSKINALLIHLEMIRQESPGEKVIVFSQFTSFLDIIETELSKFEGEFDVLKFDGRLNLEQRQKILNDFDKPQFDEKKISVLLLSLKAGGVGLNLTVASRAFLMDPHWNNAIEFQAIDRLHRFGQLKNVEVIRFIMKDSIEERMLEIQASKNQLGETLTMSDEERKKRRLEELQKLFKQ